MNSLSNFFIRKQERKRREHGTAHRTISRRLVENCLYLKTTSCFVFLLPLYPLSISHSRLKTRYMHIRVCAVCARDSKKGSRAIRWQLFHIWRMDILQALLQRQKASSYKRTWSNLCALALSYSLTLLLLFLPLHPIDEERERERERKKRINIRKSKFHMCRKGAILFDPLLPPLFWNIFLFFWYLYVI